VTFTLPADAFWADGVPVTTDDVLFSWNVGKHPQSGVANAAIYRSINRIDTSADKKTFTLHLEKASSSYNVVTDFRVLPAHVEKAAFAEPEQYRKRSLYMAAPTTAGLYDGPYRVSEVVTGSHVVLERNPYWKGKTPAFDRIVLRTIENTSALQAALLSGQIHMIAGEMGLPLDQAVSLANRLPPGLKAEFKPGLVYEHLDVNPAHPALADARVRKALLYGIDRQAISREMFGGKLPLADSSISPLEPVYTTSARRYGYDPRRAAALLDDAGWKAAGPGPRRNAAGQPLVIELGTTAGNHSRELVQQVIQAQLRQIGVEIRPFTEVSRSFFADKVTKRAFSGMILYSWFGTPGQVPRSTLHSAFIPSAANNFSGQNFTGYANPKMDALIDALEAELEPAKRADLWRQMQELYADDLPALPLFFTTASFITPDWLKGLRPTGHDAPSSLWVADWSRTASAAQR
ncbi:MAG: peptide ABC transporter substrate-binding protein, partial [Rhodospirillales bacterium]|jgi:peptide/nickel transport system substrate-binding protein